MARYIIGPDAALALAERPKSVAPGHRLLAPTLLRSQVLAQLYADVQAGRLTKRDASRRLDGLRALRIRLLGDRVLQQEAWKVAEELGWADTFVAEYVALTRLHGDALVVGDAALALALRGVCPTAVIADLAA